MKKLIIIIALVPVMAIAQDKVKFGQTNEIGLRSNVILLKDFVGHKTDIEYATSWTKHIDVVGYYEHSSLSKQPLQESGPIKNCNGTFLGLRGHIDFAKRIRLNGTIALGLTHVISESYDFNVGFISSHSVYSTSYLVSAAFLVRVTNQFHIGINGGIETAGGYQVRYKDEVGSYDGLLGFIGISGSLKL